jgi:hypothetical protein
MLIRREFDSQLPPPQMEVTPLRLRAVENHKRHLENPKRYLPEPMLDPTFNPYLTERR